MWPGTHRRIDASADGRTRPRAAAPLGAVIPDSLSAWLLRALLSLRLPLVAEWATDLRRMR